MKIVYDTKDNIYIVKVEYPETEIWISTNDIAKARSEFVERMTQVFDNAVCDKFTDDTTKYLATKATNKICESDSDHQWECCGVSTGGSTYMCRICGKTKHEPAKYDCGIVLTSL
jgi:hypothetical protein